MKFKCLNVIIFTFSSLIISNQFAKGQDIHFSQFHATPLIINPANTGNAPEDLRIVNNYRSQWRSIDYPYHTYSFSIDRRMFMFGRMFGIGGFVLHDQSSNNRLVADKVYFSLSHSFFYKNHQFVAGIQPGVVLKYINNDGITFGSQFDPTQEKYDPNLPNYEDFLDDRMVYFDLNAGFLWRARIEQMIPTVGFSISHLNRPVESFFSSNDSIPLALKYFFHGNIVIPFHKRYELNPFTVFTYSNGANDFLTGTTFAYYPEKIRLFVSKVYAVTSFRVNPARNFDAVVLGGGARIADFDICVTYDLNVSTLRSASNYRGAFEISVIFTKNKRISTGSGEPCYML